MNCDQFQHLIWEDLNDEMETHLRPEFDSHLKTCGDCRRARDSRKNFGGLIREGSKPLPNSRDWEKRLLDNIRQTEKKRTLHQSALLPMWLMSAAALILVTSLVFGKKLFPGPHFGAAKDNENIVQVKIDMESVKTLPGYRLAPEWFPYYKLSKLKQEKFRPEANAKFSEVFGKIAKAADVDFSCAKEWKIGNLRLDNVNGLEATKALAAHLSLVILSDGQTLYFTDSHDESSRLAGKNNLFMLSNFLLPNMVFDYNKNYPAMDSNYMPCLYGLGTMDELLEANIRELETLHDKLTASKLENLQSDENTTLASIADMISKEALVNIVFDKSLENLGLHLRHRSISSFSLLEKICTLHNLCAKPSANTLYLFPARGTLSVSNDTGVYLLEGSIGQIAKDSECWGVREDWRVQTLPEYIRALKKTAGISKAFPKTILPDDTFNLVELSPNNLELQPDCRAKGREISLEESTTSTLIVTRPLLEKLTENKTISLTSVDNVSLEKRLDEIAEDLKAKWMIITWAPLVLSINEAGETCFIQGIYADVYLLPKEQ